MGKQEINKPKAAMHGVNSDWAGPHESHYDHSLSVLGCNSIVVYEY